MSSDDLNGYLRAREPGMRGRAYAWKTAIGLQQVDGLTPSDFLIETAKRNIDGDITLAESRELLEGYHRAKKVAGGELENRTAEADIVSQHIAEVLSEESFTFSPEELVSIHRRLFDGVLESAGRIRDYDITKKEWVLNGDTVHYGSSYRLLETLAFDLRQEREFSYVGLAETDLIRHLSRFTANLWQIHAFGEGNTRTTGVFVIKYLRTLGFDVENDVFADNAWYFRNALVRANYTNVPKGIGETTEYLEKFFRNLLLGEQHPLQSRFLVVGGWQGDVDNPTSNPTCNPTSNPAGDGKLSRDMTEEQSTGMFRAGGGSAASRLGKRFARLVTMALFMVACTDYVRASGGDLDDLITALDATDSTLISDRTTEKGNRIIKVLGKVGASTKLNWKDPKTGIEWLFLVNGDEAVIGSGVDYSRAIPKTTSGAIEIPSEFEWNGRKKVTGIGWSAFNLNSSFGRLVKAA